MEKNLLGNNSLQIHAESRNIFYDNFNTNEIFFNFLLARQDETKQFIPKPVSYHHSFERYIKQFLLEFLLKERNKYDLLANKNSKYLPYQFNDWIESLNAEKIKIRHFLAVEDNVRLVQIEKKKTVLGRKNYL